MTFILKSSDPLDKFDLKGGGKAANLARLSQKGYPVPPWFCIQYEGFEAFVQSNSLKDKIRWVEDPVQHEIRVEKLFKSAKFSEALQSEILQALDQFQFSNEPVSVRSSGIGEDSSDHSFAGLFSTFLYQKGSEAILESIKRCWASAYSARASMYRNERGIVTSDIRMGVIIQKMVHADSAGVVFSRNPIHPLDRAHLIISSVFGLGEGLVSGELDADHFEVNRETLQTQSKLTQKTHAMRQNDPSREGLLKTQVIGESGGLIKVEVPLMTQESASIDEEQVSEIARMAIQIEKDFGSPQDSEWAYEQGQLYLLQTRPITHLPPDAFFESQVNGDRSTLWDNSNIVESYSGVTSPLTFSFASYAYRQVYLQFCELIKVPKSVIVEQEVTFRNMLGILRGRIYYNLENWHRLVQFLPGGSKNSDYMDTMMGVKQKRSSDSLNERKVLPPSFWRKVMISGSTFYRFLRIDSTIETFNRHFDQVYQEVRVLPFERMSLTDLAKVYQRLDDQILRRWQAPIINDCLCMVFFGVLKKLTEKWIRVDQEGYGASLQNDLLCGQGDLESTEPTKMLMRIASSIDQGEIAAREWFTSTSAKEVWRKLQTQSPPSDISRSIHKFLDQYGFRCVNELKLEELDLHDNPEFVIDAIKSYIKMKSYSISEMEQREKKIRTDAESLIRTHLKGLKYLVYSWVVEQARKSVKNRENLRFARTKIFGVARHLFRGMGTGLCKLGVLLEPRDIFYLTTEEIIAYIEGRAVSLNLNGIIQLRKKEYQAFKKTPSPPDRFMTEGVVGASCSYSQVLSDLDLMRGTLASDLDPDVLFGTPCCPGVIEGIVRVVESASDASGMSGEILVTAKTDPGWVPLFPSCSGLLIERGSLLSHSAVVARELGLPTIVGISGGLLTKLKTGQRVRMDAGKGEVRIIE